ncbi:MAG: hypothetical protein ACTFAL_11590 [Candidatus Electronema sp. V4]|uniref:hypothetical protein n=1 Tax=Candidatus Electronema sp. V4 TaxID=3454756 RepID=UPI0040556454
MAIIQGTVSEKEFKNQLAIIDNKINDIAERVNDKIEKIQNITGQLPDTEIKYKINKELSSLKEETEAKIKLEQHRIDGLERKSKIWLSFLQRESAASIIGGIVLLMLTVALISGMIFGRESQILSNGFLVILGYFFGQSSSKNKDGM